MNGFRAALAILVVTACGDGLAGPADSVLIGQFGIATMPIELLATHAGIELDLDCGRYFASSESALLAPDGSFRLRGRYHAGSFVIPSELGATISGAVGSQSQPGTVSVTLTLDGSGPLADPFSITLTRGVRFEGQPQACPV